MTRLFRLTLVVASVLASLSISQKTWAQNNGGIGGGNNVNNFAQPIAGVDIDATGVLKIRMFDPRVAQQRLMAARQQRDNDLMRPSKLRKVSLQRLEAAVRTQLENGGQISDDLRAMAGLTSIDYVFFYPETKDIVIAGPAEGFVADPTDRFVGLQTGQPTLLLEDVVTALRAYAPQAQPTNVISVSIDPTAEGLQRLQQFLGSIRNVNRGMTPQIVAGLKNNLGLQKVTIKGVPTNTHFARVLVEADYRMKLVGIGLERLPVRMKSFVDRSTPGARGNNALERWYFQPRYDGISVSDDGLAMKINERDVELVGENERVVDGKRTVSGRANPASQAFCRDFTEKFPEIASKVRIFAEMRQLMNVAIAAAYIQEQDFYTQAGWNMPLLGDEDAYSVGTYNAPQQVETAVNAIWRGNQLMTPLGGGVQMQPRKALSSDAVSVDSSGENKRILGESGPHALKDGQWWWD